LTQLANTPDKERGSIMSTALLALAIFRNAAVRNRTSHSDFHFSDLRGIKDPKTGKFKPTFVYLSVNMVDADAVNPITAIFIELMSHFLLANAPEGIHAGNKLGPYPVLFVLDEFPKMQKLQAVIQGPDLGRGQKVSYLIIGQDLNQIKERYGPESTATLMSTTAAKIIMKQNDVETAKIFSEILGKERTKQGEDKDGKPIPDKEKDLYSPLDIRALKDSKVLISYQANPKAVIEGDKEYYFMNPKLKAMVLPEAPPLPQHLGESHILQMGYDQEKIAAARRAAGKK
jgi:type IV secretion system protein VirD4